MGKVVNYGEKGSSNDWSKECGMRRRRRESQAKHRHQLALCYEKLRKSLPRVCEEAVPTRSPTSLKKRVISLSKPHLLQRSKKYILHLENALSSLLEKRKSKSSVPLSNVEEQNFSNPVSRTTADFNSLSDFRRNFARQFDVQSDVLSYFQDVESCSEAESEIVSQGSANPNFRNIRFVPPATVSSGSKQMPAAEGGVNDEQGEFSSQSSTKSKESSQSFDPGFFSAEGGSQDKVSEKHASEATSKIVWGQSFELQTFGNPFQLQQPTFGGYTNGGFLDNSSLYFYVPTAGCSAPFCAPYRPFLNSGFSPAAKNELPGRRICGGFSGVGSFGTPLDLLLQPVRKNSANVSSNSAGSSENRFPLTFEICSNRKKNLARNFTQREESLSTPIIPSTGVKDDVMRV